MCYKMNEFSNTRVGRKFIEWTVPELINQLDKLNRNIEKLLEEDKPKDIGEVNRQIRDGINNIVEIKKRSMQ